ncbi:MAG TPA: hypothetical protein VG826_04075 [Pirellulales bacterium]|nr:hypothetical protein [Pirellulales bacterium]
MRGAVLLLCFSASLSLGCQTVSVNPLASDNVIEFDEGLLGVWITADPETGREEYRTLITASGKGYRLQVQGQPAHTEAKLVRLGDTRILDMTYAEKPDEPAHHFFLIQGIGDSRTIACLDLQKIQQIVKEKEPTLALAKPNDRWAFTHLDWSTEQLQGFFSRHGEAAFIDSEYRESMKRLPADKK